MLKGINFKNESIIIILFVLIAVISMVSISPFIHPVPHRDSGIFLYVASQINQGKNLYIDVWDHKPPLIFIIDSIGLRLSDGKPWGVWIVELFFVLALLFLSYLIGRRFLKPIPSFLITSGVFLTIFQFFGGNYSEEYAILFGVSTLFIFIYFDQFKKPIACSITIGIISGLIFNLKQTYMDITLAIIFLWLLLTVIEKKNLYLKQLFGLMIGFVLINLLIVIYFYSQNSLVEYWNSAFVYNFSYSAVGLKERILAILDSLEEMIKLPWIYLTLVIWLFDVILLVLWFLPRLKVLAQKKVFLSGSYLLFFVFLMAFIFARLNGDDPGLGIMELVALATSLFFLCISVALSMPKTKEKLINFMSGLENGLVYQLNETNRFPSKLLLLGLLDLPLVIIFISLSGRNYWHYYTMLYPVILILILNAVYFLFGWFKPSSQQRLPNLLLFCLFIIAIFPTLLMIKTNLIKEKTINPILEVATYLKRESTRDDTVLVWGGANVINYLADRSAPTRYSIQYAAYQKSSLQSMIISTILSDIKNSPPLYIIDTLDDDTPFINNQTTDECLAGINPGVDGIVDILRFVCSNYQFIEKLGGMNIYRLATR